MYIEEFNMEDNLSGVVPLFGKFKIDENTKWFKKRIEINWFNLRYLLAVFKVSL
tara:strand:- start:416 stop:577 length:162 start_codon:yes stop_codon:yes gene_type:complete